MSISNPQAIEFGPFRVDLPDGDLHEGTRLIPLAPKSLGVLRYLAQNPGRVVTKEELLDAVWPTTSVGDAVLKVAVHEIRAALREPTAEPRFLSTVHRRGYRFLIPAKEDDGADERTPAPAARPPMTGRTLELASLAERLESARRGERQIVFVSGEAGIGKTTLIEAFLASVAEEYEPRVARGQCVEHFGVSEPYFPVLEALGRLCRGPVGESVVALLRDRAPTWLVQMPWLLPSGERGGLERETLGGSRPRMLREIAEAVEAFTERELLVLVLEDLHWSDRSTLELLRVLAARRESARFLLIASYRPVDVILAQHPLRALKQELVVRSGAEEISLDALSEAAIDELLDLRFPENDFPADLAAVLHRRTDGHPLFLVTVLGDLLARGVITSENDEWRLRAPAAELADAIPDSVRQLIEHQLDRVSGEDRGVLEAGAIAGLEFSSAIVGHALDRDPLSVEKTCDRLASENRFLRPPPPRAPERRAAGRYRFRHALHRDVLIQRLGLAQRARLHRGVGEAKATLFGARASAFSAELAVHFEIGGDLGTAARRLARAAGNAAQRYAYGDALRSLSRALELAERLPPTESAVLGIELLERRGAVHRSAGNMPAAVEDFAIVAADARAAGRADDEVRALLSLGGVLFWFDRPRCLPVIDRILDLLDGLEDEVLRAHARGLSAGWSLELRGWSDADARASIESLEVARRSGRRADLAAHLARHAYFRLHRSEYIETCALAEEALEISRQVGDAYSHFVAQVFRAWALLYRGRWGEMRGLLDEGIATFERNENALAARILRLAMAMLHEQARDFRDARDIAERVRRESEAAWHPYGQLLSLLILGRAELGLGHLDRALDALELVRECAPNVLLDWILKMPLELSLGECRLAAGDPARARAHGAALCDLARRPGERTYLALGHWLSAEAALGTAKLAEAEREVAAALALVESGDLPIAEWRVCAAAERLQLRRGRRAEAKRYRARCGGVLRRLADSLGEADAGLRRSILSAGCG